MSLFSEFKQFAMRGNVIDMAVGIIIGGAFTPIVNSLVNDVIMPPVGMLLGGVDFSELAVTIRHATETSGAVMIKYGVFINTIITFLIVAFAVFMLIKGVNRLSHHKKEEPAAPPAPTADQQLLTEIRDLLKK
jgi:large conductance mechanosensitive channel